MANKRSSIWGTNTYSIGIYYVYCIVVFVQILLLVHVAAKLHLEFQSAFWPVSVGPRSDRLQPTGCCIHRVSQKNCPDLHVLETSAVI